MGCCGGRAARTAPRRAEREPWRLTYASALPKRVQGRSERRSGRRLCAARFRVRARLDGPGRIAALRRPRSGQQPPGNGRAGSTGPPRPRAHTRAGGRAGQAAERDWQRQPCPTAFVFRERRRPARGNRRSWRRGLGRRTRPGGRDRAAAGRCDGQGRGPGGASPRGETAVSDDADQQLR